MQGQQTHRSPAPTVTPRRGRVRRLVVAAGLLVVVAGVAAALLPPAGHSSAAPEARKVLFVHGGWAGHEPVKCRDIFVPWMKSLGWDVTVSDTQDVYADEELMGSLDLVVQIWTMDTIGKENLAGLLEAVRGGVGLAGWHGGLGDAYRQEVEYQFMVGGQWVAHPGNIIDYTVSIADGDDPITAGLSSFKMHSEQYYMHVDPNVTVLATTAFSGEHAPWIDGATMPVVWKKVYGKGRVFYTSLGHVAKDFEVPEALTIMQRGIRWAAESRHAETPDLVAPVYPGQ